MNISLTTAEMSESFDFIIVGGMIYFVPSPNPQYPSNPTLYGVAGTSGGYLAHRLATSAYSPSVLLLETGPNTIGNASKSKPAENPNLFSLIPGNFAENLAQQRTNYMYTTTPQKDLDGRVLVYHRGRGLGGTSMLNYMAWIKGYKGDFDEWAQQVGDSAYGGTEGWERIKRVTSTPSSLIGVRRRLLIYTL